MIVDDSFSRLTTRMICHHSFRSVVLVITGPIAVGKHAAALAFAAKNSHFYKFVLRDAI